MDTLPVEGWVTRWASYGMAIVRTAVTEIRDRGPLDADQVCAVIRQAGLGADVAKASPTFDYDDGARRILNLLADDVVAITHVVDGDYHLYSVDPDVRSVYSAELKRFIDTPSAETLTAQAEASRRLHHLRRWISDEPFKGVWRAGIRTYTDEQIAAMAERIEQMGYYGPRIVADQNGTVIDGHLREAALNKLGRDASEYTEEIFFPNDTYRLAWIINVHYVDGKWPSELRKAITRYIDHSMVRSGVKLDWPADLPLITGHFDEVPKPAVGSIADVVEEPVKEVVSFDVRPRQRQRKRTHPDPLEAVAGGLPVPGKGTAVAIALMTLLERDRPMTIGQLESAGVPRKEGNEGPLNESVLYRHRKVGLVDLSKKTRAFTLTETGVALAEGLWRRDRSERAVPSRG